MAVGTPISLIVSVVPGVFAATGTLDFLNGLILTQNVTAVPAATLKSFSTLADVGLAFGTGSNEYKMAAPYFAGQDNALQFPAVLYFGGVGSEPDYAALMTTFAEANLQWTGFSYAFEPALADKKTLATWTGSQNSRYWFVAWDTDPEAEDATSTESVGAWLVSGSLSGTTPIYSDPVAAGAALGWMASLNVDQVNGRQNLTFTQNGLVTPIAPTLSQSRGLLVNGYTWYGQFSGPTGDFSHFYGGAVSGPFLWADSYINQIVINTVIQTADVITFRSFGDIPMNTQGDAIISAGRKPRINQMISFGAIQSGVAISDSQKMQINRFFGVDGAADAIINQGYYEQPGASTASSANRAARTIPNSRFAYADGQSVQMITLLSREVV